MEFYKTILENENSTLIASNVLLLCEGAHSHKVFSNEGHLPLHCHIKNINHQLNLAKTNQFRTLHRLLLILPQCNNEIITEIGDKWFNLCLQILKIEKKFKLRSACYTVIKFIFKHCGKLKDLSNKIAKINPTFLKHFYSNEGENVDLPFECLYEYIKLFPGQTLSHRKQIESCVAAYLNKSIHSDCSGVVAAARVYAALPIPGAGAKDIAQAKGAQLTQLMALAHSALDILFHEIRENEFYDFTREQSIPMDTLNSATELKDPVRSLITGSSVLVNTFIFINEFLSWSTSDFINVIPKELLRLVFRVLQVETKTLKASASVEVNLLAFLIPSLHQRALVLLKTLISNYVGDLFFGVIGDQLLSTLKASSQKLNLMPSKSKDTAKKPPGTQEDTQLQGDFTKVLAYDAFVELLTVSQGCFAPPSALTSMLIDDVMQSNQTVSLKDTKGGKLNLINLKKKKNKKKGYSVSKEEKTTFSENLADCAVRISVTQAALRVIRALFLYGHHSVSLKKVRILHKCLVDLLDLPRQGVYKDPAVITSLYSCVLAYATYPHPLCPPSYSLILHALQKGSRDQNPQVSKICHEGLSNLLLIMANPKVTMFTDYVRLQKEELAVTNREKEDNEDLIEGVEDGLVLNMEESEEEDDDDNVENDTPIMNGINGHDKDDDDKIDTEIDKEENMGKALEEKEANETKEERVNEEIVSKEEEIVSDEVEDESEDETDEEDEVGEESNDETEEEKEVGYESDDENEEDEVEEESEDEIEVLEMEITKYEDNQAKSAEKVNGTGETKEDFEDESKRTNQIQNGECAPSELKKNKLKRTKKNETKRKSLQENSDDTPKHKKVKTQSKKTEIEISIEEMLSSFVDADPDSN